MDFVPQALFFTAGVGVHREQLNSFELALRDAGISGCNLVYVSSILPPNCKIIKREEGLKYLKPGEIVFCVMARMQTNEPGQLVSSAIGCAIPDKEKWDKGQHGYISECHKTGMTNKETAEFAEDQAAEMMASLLDVDLDWDKAWDRISNTVEIKGRPVHTRSVVQSAVGRKSKRPDAHPGDTWVTTVAAAVMLLDFSPKEGLL